MQPLNVIKDYYGEEAGFYFSWFMHYTGWLIPLSIIGLLYCLITVPIEYAN